MDVKTYTEITETGQKLTDQHRAEKKLTADCWAFYNSQAFLLKHRPFLFAIRAEALRQLERKPSWFKLQFNRDGYLAEMMEARAVIETIDRVLGWWAELEKELEPNQGVPSQSG